MELGSLVLAPGPNHIPFPQWALACSQGCGPNWASASSKAGSVPWASLCPQLWAHCLAPSSTWELFVGWLGERRVVPREGLRGSQSKPPGFISALRHSVAAWTLSFRSEKARGSGGIVRFEQALFGLDLLWHCPFLPLFCLHLKTYLGFLPLGLHTSLSFVLSVISPCSTCCTLLQPPIYVCRPFFATLTMNSLREWPCLCHLPSDWCKAWPTTGLQTVLSKWKDA